MESFEHNRKKYILVNLPISDAACHQCDIYWGFNTTSDVEGNKEKKKLCNKYGNICSNIIGGRQNVWKVIFETIDL